jgi:uncharacterized protein YfdQ (DUF2303 family)
MSDVSINAEVLKEAVALGQKLGVAQTEGVEVPYAIVPAGSTLTTLLSFKFPHGLPPQKPDHIKAQALLADATSFCHYVMLYSDARTRIFANPEKFSFRAVLDYHRAYPQNATESSPDTPTPNVGAEFLDHVANFQMKQSEQWTTWIEKNGKAMPQAEFAEMVEDNIKDVVRPSAAEFLEVSRDLQGHIDVSFASKVSHKNGATQLSYQEVVTAGVGEAGTIEVPETFAINIPVFFGEKPVTIEARLRFKVSQGKITFLYKLSRPTEIQAQAFQFAVAGIKESLGMDVLMGSV